MASRKTAEDRVEQVIIDNGYPRPVRQYRAVPGRRFRADFAWPEFGLILEVEGGVFNRGRHVRPAGYIKDIEKYNLYALHGWKLYRIIPKDAENGYLLEVLDMMFGD